MTVKIKCFINYKMNLKFFLNNKLYFNDLFEALYVLFINDLIFN
jgi:hypothetical protein